MKKIFLTSLILVLVPTLIFLPAYIFLVYTSAHDVQNYSEDIKGQWDAIQYYHGNERVACKDDVWMSITFDDDTITIDGTVLSPTESKYTWSSGTALTFDCGGETFLFLLSFDSNNNLKIIVDGTEYIFILRRNEG